jgi:hypothetical protein
MTAAPKWNSPLKLHYGGGIARRTPVSWGEADVLREETSASTEGARRGRGPSAYTRIAEITSGRANSQQGLVATCKDPPYKEIRKRWEGFGLAHGRVGAMKAG